jgi:hypothetical protein
LSKFLGAYDYFKDLVRNYGVKWAGKRSEDLLIQRLTKTVDAGDLGRWVKDVKQALPELSTFMGFVASVGIRFEEAIAAWNLIIDLSAEGRSGEYYKAENQALEHFRFKDIFIRRGKKTFVSFVPEDLVQKIAAGDKVTRDGINSKLKRRKIRARFSDLREYYASIMPKHLKQPEIDFLQGRISTSVFMRNYFNPAWISDLKTRALQGAQELLATLN